jgi:hypothetical protein
VAVALVLPAMSPAERGPPGRTISDMSIVSSRCKDEISKDIAYGLAMSVAFVGSVTSRQVNCNRESGDCVYTFLPAFDTDFQKGENASKDTLGKFARLGHTEEQNR